MYKEAIFVATGDNFRQEASEDLLKEIGEQRCLIIDMRNLEKLEDPFKKTLSRIVHANINHLHDLPVLWVTPDSSIDHKLETLGFKELFRVEYPEKKLPLAA